MAVPGETPDQVLVAAVRRGDDRAFEQLYGRYQRRIAAYVYGMVNDYGRAEDITQDVFISALRRMRETERPIAFKPWIYEIAKNACIDQFRRTRRTEEVSFDAEEGLGAADYGRLAQAGPQPDAAVDQKQQLEQLCGAFGGLSETHHEILVLRELEGLSYREIGERMGLSRPSVESTLFRARRRLTEEYDELATGERCLRIQGIIDGAVDGTLGARDGRRMSRHLSHCQPCRRHARALGVEGTVLVRRPVRAAVAAMFPLPAFLRHRRGADPIEAAHVATTHSANTFSQISGQVSTYAEPMVANWTKAVAAAASVALAGVGAGTSAPLRDSALRDASPTVPGNTGRAVTAPKVARSFQSALGASASVPASLSQARRGAPVPDAFNDDVPGLRLGAGSPGAAPRSTATGEGTSRGDETATGPGSPGDDRTAAGPESTDTGLGIPSGDETPTTSPDGPAPSGDGGSGSGTNKPDADAKTGPAPGNGAPSKPSDPPSVQAPTVPVPPTGGGSQQGPPPAPQPVSTPPAPSSPAPGSESVTQQASKAADEAQAAGTSAGTTASGAVADAIGAVTGG